MANRSQVEALQKIISPFMLRRVKEDVAKDIPAKEETVIDVELTGIQKQYYRAIFEHNHAFLNMGGTRQNVPKLMNIQMELRRSVTTRSFSKASNTEKRIVNSKNFWKMGGSRARHRRSSSIC